MTEGTKEWSDHSLNIHGGKDCWDRSRFGCKYNCLYCWAKEGMVRRKQIIERLWPFPRVNRDKILKGYRKVEGRTMFPTTHDIYEENFDSCILVLLKNLKAGNEMLITTKPNYKCVKDMCYLLEDYKDLIQFRFTITSYHAETLEKFEPLAPSFEERLKSLKHAHKKDFKTSVSIEPFLDKPTDLIQLIQKVEKYCTESIWIGPMNPRMQDEDFWDHSLWGTNALNDCYNIIKYHMSQNKIKAELIRFKDSFKNKVKNKKSKSISKPNNVGLGAFFKMDV